MIGRGSTVSNKLDVKGRSILQIMKWYYEDSLIVNRRYQRKLVWSLEEKRLFIDSIINQYPTPSIIVSEYTSCGNDYYEIIDGLQRLNAIVSFVNNEYGIIVDGQEYFFDMQFIPSCRRLIDAGMQRIPVLDYEVSERFSFTEIPVILTAQGNGREEKVEKIFQRINSSGRKLSAHDIRQASSVGEFPDLVRRVAASCRGDYTYSDEIHLSDMPKISLSSEGLHYGVDPATTFWIKHGIIQFERLRQSKDEEIIASALAIALLGKDFRITTDSLNALYRGDTPLSCNVTSIIERMGKDELERYAIDVINQINDIFDSVDSNFTDYLCPRGNARNKYDGFIVLFCTLFRLKREGFIIEDYRRVAEALRAGFGSDMSLSKLNVIYSVLQQNMVKQLEKIATDDELLIETLLSLAPTESQMVEFKIGLTYFDSGELNANELERIWQTLVAMSNTTRDGYVIVGVANSDAAYQDWKRVYDSMALNYGRHKVVGITSEAIRYCSDEDHYEQRIRNLIKNSKISEPLKSFVLANYRLVDFHGKTLLLIPSRAQKSTSYYGNLMYRREGTSTVKSDVKAINAF